MASKTSDSFTLRKRFPLTWPVFPVDSDGHCTCWDGPTCRRPGKHADPKAPADSPAYAVLCGPGGVLVLDPDVKSGVDGYEELKRWSLPDTFTVATPSGGAHIYYKHPGGELSNRPLGTGVDVRANPRRDGGHAYVIGPGSPGYLKTNDPCRVEPGPPYSVIDDLPFANAPEDLVAFLKIDAEKQAGAPVNEIDETHPAWELVCRQFTEDCKTMPPSTEDGQGSANLMAIVRRGARRYQLPDDKALEIIQEHWNSRCTKSDGVTPYPWDDGDIVRALERSRASGPGEGMADQLLARENGTDIAHKMRKHTIPKGLRNLLPVPKPRKKPDAAHTYQYVLGELSAQPKADKASFNELISHYAKHPKWSGVWQYDAFAQQIVAVDPPIKLDAEAKGITEDDLGALRSCLEFEGIRSDEKEIRRAVRAAGRANEFHPVREYLSSLPEGNPEIFRGLAKRLFGDEGDHADAFLEKTMVAAVRRALQPGCQVDTVLILHGPEQGEGKTQFVKWLFGKQWTRSGLPADLGNRDAAHALLGFWCVELGEMTHLSRSEQNLIKRFVSEEKDDYRQYGNGDRVRDARQCIFIGTTNDDDFLRDSTGNRRYWPISIPREHTIPLDWLRENRDALWAAAVTLALDESYLHWFTRDEEKQLAATREPFVDLDGWHDKIEAYCASRHVDGVNVADVFTNAIGGELKALDDRARKRIQSTLKRMKWESKAVNGKRAWRPTMPAETPKCASPVPPKNNVLLLRGASGK